MKEYCAGGARQPGSHSAAISYALISVSGTGGTGAKRNHPGNELKNRLLQAYRLHMTAQHLIEHVQIRTRTRTVNTFMQHIFWVVTNFTRASNRKTATC